MDDVDDVVILEAPPAACHGMQLTLFRCTTEEVLRQLELRPVDAGRLYETELLSFDPQRTEELDPPQEAELRFLGNLLRAGCDLPLIRTLLADLSPPYAYGLERLVFDFRHRRWFAVRPVTPEEAVDYALACAEADGDPNVLAGMGHKALDGLRALAADRCEE
ncbi:MAG: hypothetical protein D6798_03750 [Deltaproteobacteria bacterium]|nr:MAG: hypothetical protein D6798_03750 [Deltaproteobacteria bacterium]